VISEWHSSLLYKAVVLMKDRAGRGIRFEKLNFSVPDSDPLRVALETVPA
jgi:hypothetical protein